MRGGQDGCLGPVSGPCLLSLAICATIRPLPVLVLFFVMMESVSRPGGVLMNERTQYSLGNTSVNRVMVSQQELVLICPLYHRGSPRLQIYRVLSLGVFSCAVHLAGSFWPDCSFVSSRREQNPSVRYKTKSTSGTLLDFDQEGRP